MNDNNFSKLRNTSKTSRIPPHLTFLSHWSGYIPANKTFPQHSSSSVTTLNQPEESLFPISRLQLQSLFTGPGILCRNSTSTSCRGTEASPLLSNLSALAGSIDTFFIIIIFLGIPPDGSSMSPQQNWEHFSKGQLLILGTDTRLPKLSPTQSEPQGTELVADIKIWIFFSTLGTREQWILQEQIALVLANEEHDRVCDNSPNQSMGKQTCRTQGKSPHICPCWARPSPCQVSRQSRCSARDSWFPQKWCPAERGHGLCADTRGRAPTCRG